MYETTNQINVGKVKTRQHRGVHKWRGYPKMDGLYWKSYETGWFGGISTSPITIILVTGPWRKNAHLLRWNMWNFMGWWSIGIWGYELLVLLNFTHPVNVAFINWFSLKFWTCHGPHHPQPPTGLYYIAAPHQLSVGKPTTNHRNHQSSWFLSNLSTTSSFKKQTYPLVICYIAIEYGPVEIVSFPS